MRLDKLLVDSGAVKRTDTKFTLKSGVESDIYVDCRSLIMDSRYVTLVGSVLGHYIMSHFRGPIILAGVAEGGIPLVASILANAPDDPEGHWRGGWVRKDAKSHGVGGQLAGNLKKGMEVILVEDVVTSGDSAIDAIKTLNDNDILVQGVVAILDRTYDTPRRWHNPFEAIGIPFGALTTIAKVRAELPDA